jgi:holo-[acyl-carrier protein] synthase
MIIGIGVDIVDVERFKKLAERQPTFINRVLTDAEQIRADGTKLNTLSLASRFAAKEAVAKSLGAPAGLSWHDCEVLGDINGRPSVNLRGTVLAESNRQGVKSFHISISHDGDFAIAYVVAEG